MRITAAVWLLILKRFKKMPSIPCKLFFRKVECFCSSLVVSYRPIYGFCVILPPQEKFASYGPARLSCTAEKQ